MSADLLTLAVTETVKQDGIWHMNADGTPRANTGAHYQCVSMIEPDATAVEVAKSINAEWTATVERLHRLSDPSASRHDAVWVPTGAYEIVRDTDGAHLAYRLTDDDDEGKTVVQPIEILNFLSDLRERTNGKWQSGGVLARKDEATDSIRNPSIFAQIRVGEPVLITGQEFADRNILVYYNYRTGILSIKSCLNNSICNNTVQQNLGTNGRLLSARDFSGSTLSKFSTASEQANRLMTATAMKQRELANFPIDFDGADVLTYCAIMEDAPLLDKIVNMDTFDAASKCRELVADKKFRRDSGRVSHDILYAIQDGVGQTMTERLNNWHGVEQGVSYYVDHTAGRMEETRIEASYFGARSVMKENAILLAEIMAGVN